MAWEVRLQHTSARQKDGVWYTMERLEGPLSEEDEKWLKGRMSTFSRSYGRDVQIVEVP